MVEIQSTAKLQVTMRCYYCKDWTERLVVGGPHYYSPHINPETQETCPASGFPYCFPTLMINKYEKVGHCYYCHRPDVHLRTEEAVDYFATHNQPDTENTCPASGAPFIYPLGYVLDDTSE